MIGRSFGAPRNPRCQGLVERLNFTMKSGTMKRMLAAGYTATDLTFEWHRMLLQQVAMENRESIKTYGAVTPFLLLRGRPAEFPTAVYLDGATHDELRAKCAALQKEKAEKKSFALPIGENDVPDVLTPSFCAGEFVRVRAGGTVRHKDPNTVAAWSARAIVVSMSKTDMFYKLQWLTGGLSGERPGSMSRRWYYHSRLRIDGRQEDCKKELQR